MVFIEREITVGSTLNSFFTYKQLAGGISDFIEDIVSETGSDSGGISSHDGSESDTDSDHNPGSST